MSLNAFMSSIAEEFSGREFTGKDLMNFITRLESDSGDEPKKESKEPKEPKKEKKKRKMNVRNYFMTHYKARINEQVKENKEWNIENAVYIGECDVEKRSEHFMGVLKIVMDELSTDEVDDIKEKVAEYIKENGEYM